MLNDRRRLLAYTVLIVTVVALLSAAGAGYQFWLLAHDTPVAASADLPGLDSTDGIGAQPLIGAISLAVGTALVVTFGGGALLLRAVNPFIFRLQQSEGQMRTILATAADGIITLDQLGEVHSCNEAAQRLFGYDADEIVGRSIDRLMPWLMLREAAWGEQPTDRKSQPAVASLELTGRHKSGKFVAIETSTSVFMVDRRPMATVIVRDIELRKQAQEQTRRHVEMLQAARQQLESRVNDLEQINTALQTASDAEGPLSPALEQLQRTHRDLDHFVRALSHDMNANFMLLQSSFHALKSSCQESSGAGLTHGLAHVEACLNESKRFLDDLVTLAKTGSVHLEPEAVDLKTVVESVVFEQDDLLRARAVVVQIESNLPTVWCNESRVRQVVTNLVRNAVRHGCDAKQPRIHISGWPAGSPANGQKNGKFCWLAIHDNGRGISSSVREEIFLPGRRLPSAHPEGSGMGLAIVKKIVDHYGGQVLVDPHCTSGTRFLVSLPAASNATSPARRDKSARVDTPLARQQASTKRMRRVRKS